jgi:EmrB/QacA subfamily drug resistance transporter
MTHQTSSPIDHVAPPTPGLDRVHERRWWTLSILCLTLVLISVDNTILNVAIPTLARDLDASGSQLQWIVDAYVLVFAGLLLTAGSLGDKFGRRGALILGMGIFGVGSVAAAMAESPGQLIAFRALMGIGGAFIMPATLSILTNVFRDPKERAKAIAIWAGCSGLGVALGPVTGGWLLEHFSWGSVFLVNLPVLTLAIAGSIVLVPTSKDPRAPKLDWGGAALSMAGLATLLWALIEAPERGWTSSNTMLAFGAAVVVLAVFAWWESRRAEPMLDLSLFTNPRFSAASGAVTMTFFALFGSLFIVTQYLQSVMGYSALQAGIRYLPLAGMLLVTSPMSAKLAERIGTKIVVSCGLLSVAIGLLLMLRLDTDTGYAPVLTAMLVLAFGMGLTMAPATESIMGSLPREKAGVGSAVNDTTREVGGALGVAVLGSVLSSVFGSRMTDAMDGVPMPGEVAHVAEHSIGGALSVAQEVGGDAGAAIVAAARSAFVDGFHTTSIVAAGFALFGAVVALVFLPATAPATPEEDEDDVAARFSSITDGLDEELELQSTS